MEQLNSEKSNHKVLVSIQNETCSLTLDLNGGAITDFHLTLNKVNPLSFAFTKDQMPENNKAGAAYQGHFLCLGRWGEPSAGEMKAGLPNHGEIANIPWYEVETHQDTSLEMQTNALLEGLSIHRKIVLDKHNAVFMVKENVMNVNSLGRLFSMVQHPTLAAPFLDNHIIVNSNASIGFDQQDYKEIAPHSITWKNESIGWENLGRRNDFTNRTDIVRSFQVDKRSRYGWITAYSPTSNILIGYVWPRADYPWLHIWENVNDGDLIYMGLEFGDTAIHQPFNEILNTAVNLFGESTVGFIDAGQTIEKKYVSFLVQPDQGFNGIVDMVIENEKINLLCPDKKNTISLSIDSTLLYELST
jgi:hypothetical protein